MAIPDFQSLMLPVLRTLGDGAVWKSRDLTTRIADEVNLSPEDRLQKQPHASSGFVFRNRIGWALAHLKAAGLIQNIKRGEYRITTEGLGLLAENPAEVTTGLLRRFPPYLAFARPSKRMIEDGPDGLSGQEISSEETPVEVLADAYRELHQALLIHLLDRLKSCSPQFFEKAVVELLLAMGYGGIDRRGEVTSYVADGGIDGIIHEDRLGLDLVCLQAKRYAEHAVGRPVVQAFVGSMDYHKAKKGVILTTSQFSQPALDFVRHIENKRVVLIGGEQLAEYMIHYGIGVNVKETYKICEISEDFFAQDEF